MKSFKNLYPQICSFENLLLAFRKARRGKRGKRSVAAFEMNLDMELLALQDELLSLTYRPGGYRHFDVYEGKPRRISAAPFRDRVVHHALCNRIAPIWEARFVHDSYACRPGKGTHAALDCCTAFARRYPYVLQCDVVQFFPSVDHQILLELLGRHIACPPTLALCETIIASGAGVHARTYQMQWFSGDNPWTGSGQGLLAALRPRGLPIGNQTSQFWANVYLHELDGFVKQDLRCKAYLRYCDDFMLFAADKQTLHAWRQAIEAFLAQLRLKIHAKETRVHPVTSGIPFLGFQVYPDHRRLRRANGLAFQRRYSRLRAQYRRGEITPLRLKQSVLGWLAHAAHGDTWGLRRALLRPPVSRTA